MRLYVFHDGIIARFWEKRAFLFTTLRPRPTLMCGFRTKKQLPMLLQYLDPRARYRLPPLCFWYALECFCGCIP